MTDDPYPQDEASVSWLEGQGLINELEAKRLRRKIELTRKWLGCHVWIPDPGVGGWVREITTPDLWGREIWVDCSHDGQRRAYGPEQLELEQAEQTDTSEVG